MATTYAGGSCRLELLPEDLWATARMIREVRADDQTIRQWVREGRLSRPTLRCGGRAIRGNK
jgi:hypothetical protein